MGPQLHSNVIVVKLLVDNSDIYHIYIIIYIVVIHITTIIISSWGLKCNQFVVILLECIYIYWYIDVYIWYMTTITKPNAVNHPQLGFVKGYYIPSWDRTSMWWLLLLHLSEFCCPILGGFFHRRASYNWRVHLMYRILSLWGICWDLARVHHCTNHYL